MAFGFYFDMTRCIGCRACQVACKDKNRLEVGALYREVKSYTVGAFPDVKSYSYSGSCNHCENPICLSNCPTGAISKAADGTVIQDQSKCIGCRMCMAACPYDARVFNWNEPSRSTGFAYGDARVPERSKGVMEKCTLCKERTDAGDVPMCVECCPADARIFGDLDDPNSEIAKLAAQGNVRILLEDKGTRPQVFYTV